VTLFEAGEASMRCLCTDTEVALGNRIRLGMLTLTLSAIAVTAVACGGGGKPAGAAPNGAASNGQSGFQAYTTCLRQHGVNLPSRSPRPSGAARPSGAPSMRPTARPSGGPGRGFGDQPPAGVDPKTWQDAQQACAPLRPSGGPSRDNGAFTAFRNCMADHGVTFSGRPDQLSTADPKVAAALKICEPLRPTGRPSANPSG
jgi:hypothetical protein